jgi:hypothetical protein
MDGRNIVDSQSLPIWHALQLIIPAFTQSQTNLCTRHFQCLASAPVVAGHLNLVFVELQTQVEPTRTPHVTHSSRDLPQQPPPLHYCTLLSIRYFIRGFPRPASVFVATSTVRGLAAAYTATVSLVVVWRSLANNKCFTAYPNTLSRQNLSRTPSEVCRALKRYESATEKVQKAAWPRSGRT